MDTTYPILQPRRRGKNGRRPDHQSRRGQEHRTRPACRELTTRIIPRTKTLDDFDFTANPPIPLAVINQLATGVWVKAGQPLCLIGDSGTASPICCSGWAPPPRSRAAASDTRSPRSWSTKLVEATDEKQLSNTIARYGRVDLLRLDELGVFELDRKGAELLFQVLTEREEKSAVA